MYQNNTKDLCIRVAFTTPTILYRIFKVQFLTSFKQIIVYCLAIFFFAFSFLFYQYIESYKNLVLDNLKGVYPNVFMQTNGLYVPSFDNSSFIHTLEVFELSKNLVLQYGEDSSETMLVDIGIRGFDESQPPLALNLDKDKINDKTLWVNSILWSEIASSDSFDGNGLYLRTRSNESIYVNLERFELFGDKSWAVMTASFANELGFNPNITTIYPVIEMTDAGTKEFYATKNMNATLWTERLPFFGAVFYDLITNIYLVFMTGIVLLVLLLSFGILSGTFLEFEHLILISSIYGIKLRLLNWFFVILISVYFYGILLFSMILSYIADKALQNIIAFNYDFSISLDMLVVFTAFVVFLNLISIYKTRQYHNNPFVLLHV